MVLRLAGLGALLLAHGFMLSPKVEGLGLMLSPKGPSAPLFFVTLGPFWVPKAINKDYLDH